MFRAYERGYQAGCHDAWQLMDAVREEHVTSMEALRTELQAAREAYAKLERRFDDQLDRANIAADELLLNQGGRRAISMASARFDDEQEQKQLATIKTAEAEASEMFRTRTYDDPEATFASEDEARGEYA